MKKLIPMGARVMVKDIEPLDDLSARAARSGIHVAIFEHNKPKPTTGVVVALGEDPLVHETVKLGDVVYFAKYAGLETSIDGEVYRTLELREITNILREEKTDATNEPVSGTNA